jgi:hypothetical protein
MAKVILTSNGNYNMGRWFPVGLYNPDNSKPEMASRDASNYSEIHLPLKNQPKDTTMRAPVGVFLLLVTSN